MRIPFDHGSNDSERESSEDVFVLQGWARLAKTPTLLPVAPVGLHGPEMTPPPTDDEARKHGIEFGDLNAALESHEYPASVTELIDAYGEYELGLSNGTQQFKVLLEPLGELTFESAEEVKQTIYSQVGSDAVGREDYTDRGTSPVGMSEQDDPNSI